jgi:hypothetical protein
MLLNKLYNEIAFYKFIKMYCNLVLDLHYWLIDWLIDWLIISGFTSRSRMFHLYGDDNIAGKGLQNLGLCSALKAFAQGGIFIVPHMLQQETSVCPISSDGLSHSVAFYDTQGLWRMYSKRILTDLH